MELMDMTFILSTMPDETREHLSKEAPLAIAAAMPSLISKTLIDSLYAELDHEETLMAIFWAGYLAGEYEKRVSLEDKLLGE